jgi:hypothetical protein
MLSRVSRMSVFLLESTGGGSTLRYFWGRDLQTLSRIAFGRACLVGSRFAHLSPPSLVGFGYGIPPCYGQQIDVGLSRLIALQAEFFRKGNPTPAEN